MSLVAPRLAVAAVVINWFYAFDRGGQYMFASTILLLLLPVVYNGWRRGLAAGLTWYPYMSLGFVLWFIGAGHTWDDSHNGDVLGDLFGVGEQVAGIALMTLGFHKWSARHPVRRPAPVTRSGQVRNGLAAVGGIYASVTAESHDGT